MNRLGNRGVLEGRCVEVQRPEAFGVGLLSHQAAAYIRVMRDGHSGRGLIGHLGQVGTLDPALGILQGIEVTRRQRGDCLGAHQHSGHLDNVEHLRDAVVHLADQPALGRHAVLTEGQLTGGRDLQAHLVLNVGDECAVALAGFAGLKVEQELRHHEQRESLGARACTLGAGQHQMENVLEQVVGVRGGDEPLHAVDVPGAVVLFDRLGAPGADIRACIRFGQHHGGTPTALGGENCPFLLFWGAQLVENAGEARAAGVHPSRGVGAENVFGERPDDRPGHRHPAEFLFNTDFVPAGFDQRAD